MSFEDKILIAIVVIAVATLLLVLLLAFSKEKVFALLERSAIVRKRKNKIENTLNHNEILASTLIKLSNDKTGAIIIFEVKDDLKRYVELGYDVKTKFSPEFVTSIFYNKKSPLHDGAMIVKSWEIISVSSYLPMTSKFVNVQLGARHRAAIGVSECSDSISFVVSETTGAISLIEKGVITQLPDTMYQLVNTITKTFAGKIKSK